MVRIGLSLYLMIAAAASPCFCCCTGERLAALFAFPTRQAAHCGCCGCHQPATGHQDQPGRPSCPCQQDGQQRLFLASLDSDFVEQAQAHPVIPPADLPAGALTALPVSPQGDALVTTVGRALPFVTSQDILRALHILRC
jgi:hypothetical protein